MIIIPAINETEFKEVKKKIKAAVDFGAEWVHLDVSDGKFTRNALWKNPADLRESEFGSKESGMKIEVHLMVQNPDEVLDEWLDAKVKRIIVHSESIKDIDVIKMKCVAFGVELVIAIKPDTPVEHLFKYEGDASGFLILAVNPGLAGQKFKEDQLEKIKALRQKFPSAKIEVDGGVNLETALKIKEVGADILVSASYIWNNENPKEVYQQLKNI
jgi:ribulose-phosphate 3-epimerase